VWVRTDMLCCRRKCGLFSVPSAMRNKESVRERRLTGRVGVGVRGKHMVARAIVSCTTSITAIRINQASQHNES
jgi:hypothetical protein